jgi:hypothetical protein
MLRPSSGALALEPDTILKATCYTPGSVFLTHPPHPSLGDISPLSLKLCRWVLHDASVLLASGLEQVDVF